MARLRSIRKADILSARSCELIKAVNVQSCHSSPVHCPAAEVKRVAVSLSRRTDSLVHMGGIMALCAIVFLCGAAPWAMPLVCAAFTLSVLPWRVVDFHQEKWTFFLVDFCYFVNLLVFVFLVWFPNNTRFEALAYSLADGPLAAALLAWQCSWVFGSARHCVSVLIHLLPGLAVFANRYHTPVYMRGWSGMLRSVKACWQGTDALQLDAVSPPLFPEQRLLWVLLAPMGFYLCWQGLYWLLVQVLFRGFIKSHGYDTSYNALARKGAKVDNAVCRFVRQGTIARRCVAYGSVQAAYTVVTLTAFVPVYHSYALCIVWQLIKFVVPLYYGSMYQCEKIPEKIFTTGLMQLKQLTGDSL